MILPVRPAVVLAGLALVMALAPTAAAALIVALSVAALALRHVAPRVAPTVPPPPPAATLAPVFSVHVPIYAEPPGVVITTLAALAAQDWPAFEVIVIDNNTADPALWQPVETWCAGRARFTFRHRMGVRNAKAGALDIALDLTDPAATHVVVVDADYVTAPEFLRRAADIIARHPGASAVQFPQAYRRADRAPGLAADFGRFFTTEAPVAAQAGVMLLTGTMSVIAREGLRGGWTTRSITEDAEMGLQLIGAGGRIVLSDEVMGRGLMPLTRDGLTRQRTRWVVGNLQVGWRLPRVLPAGTPWQMRLALARQLLCWHGWLLAPTAGLLAGVVIGAPQLASASAAAILAEFAVVASRARCASRPLAAAVVGWWMAWIGSLAPAEALLRHVRFDRTPKGLGASTGAPVSDLAFGVGALVLAEGAWSAGQPFGALAAGLLGLLAVAARYLDSELAALGAAYQEGRTWTSPSLSRP